MRNILALAIVGAIAASAQGQETPVTLFVFRSSNGLVQQHLFVTPAGGNLTLGVFGFNYPNPTLEADLAFRSFRSASRTETTVSLSGEYGKTLIDAGFFTFTKGDYGRFYLRLPGYLRLDAATHRPTVLVPIGRVGYVLGPRTSVGLESKFNYGFGIQKTLLGGFVEQKLGKAWARLSYLAKVNGTQPNELRLVVGTSF